MEDVDLQNELLADVEALAGQIGERNIWNYAELSAAADFIYYSFSRAGLEPQRLSYELQGKLCHNIEVEIRGARPEIVLIGAHYDSVLGSPGANDNGSGVAALLALARRFAGRAALAKAEATAVESTSYTLRFVAFVNEEPPFFQTSQMGSLVYAGRCRARGDEVIAMISLETMGYFSDAPCSQKYPAPGLGAFYPSVGNFIGFVSNTHSRALLRRVLSTFRSRSKLPAQGAALPSFIPGVAWSDQWSFWQHDYPGIMITDTAPFRYPHYHRPSDTPDKLDYRRLALAVDGMEKVIAELSGSHR